MPGLKRGAKHRNGFQHYFRYGYSFQNEHSSKVPISPYREKVQPPFEFATIEIIFLI